MIDDSVNVEDVRSYIRFVTDGVQITRPSAIAASEPWKAD
jgi:hypothetical protein